MSAQPLGRDEDSDHSYRDQLADQKAGTRRRILDAASRVFMRDGFMSANLSEIADSAGVGKGTLYRHFEGKGELYVAMLAENGKLLAQELAEALDPEGRALERIEQAARFYMDFWMRHPEHFQLIWAVQNSDLLGPLSPGMTEHLRGVFAGPMRLLEAMIRQGVADGEIRPVDPWNAANVLALSANAIIGPIVRETPQVIDRDLHAVYRQFLDLAICALAQPAAEPSDPT